MTRINTIPVTELEDKFLLAEYRELPRIAKLARPLKSSEFVDTYRMGAGHVKFFYDKGEWLRKRFELEIVPEMVRRGFKPQYTEYRNHPPALCGDWAPNVDDEMVNASRIDDRRNGRLK